MGYPCEFMHDLTFLKSRDQAYWSIFIHVYTAGPENTIQSKGVRKMCVTVKIFKIRY